MLFENNNSNQKNDEIRCMLGEDTYFLSVLYLFSLSLSLCSLLTAVLSVHMKLIPTHLWKKNVHTKKQRLCNRNHFKYTYSMYSRAVYTNILNGTTAHSDSSDFYTVSSIWNCQWKWHRIFHSIFCSYFVCLRFSLVRLVAYKETLVDTYTRDCVLFNATNLHCHWMLSYYTLEHVKGAIDEIWLELVAIDFLNRHKFRRLIASGKALQHLDCRFAQGPVERRFNGHPKC